MGGKIKATKGAETDCDFGMMIPNLGAEKPPNGSFCLDEYMEKWSHSWGRANRHIKKALKGGTIVEVGIFMREKKGRSWSCMYYKAC